MPWGLGDALGRENKLSKSPRVLQKAGTDVSTTSGNKNQQNKDNKAGKKSKINEQKSPTGLDGLERERCRRAKNRSEPVKRNFEMVGEGLPVDD